MAHLDASSGQQRSRIIYPRLGLPDEEPQMKYIRLCYDPKKETAEAFKIRMDEAIDATLPEDEVTVIVKEIVDAPPHC